MRSEVEASRHSEVDVIPRRAKNSKSFCFVHKTKPCRFSPTGKRINVFNLVGRTAGKEAAKGQSLIGQQTIYQRYSRGRRTNSEQKRTANPNERMRVAEWI